MPAIFGMNWSENLTIGDMVSYRDVNLWQLKGTLIALGKGKNGGDCIVKWHNTGNQCEECTFNLYSWREDPWASSTNVSAVRQQMRRVFASP